MECGRSEQSPLLCSESWFLLFTQTLSGVGEAGQKEKSPVVGRGGRPALHRANPQDLPCGQLVDIFKV